MPPPTDWDAATDVVVVGAGACGLTAGLRAAGRGADVLVLERDASPAGSTALSSGFVPAPGTRFQRALGVDETPGDFVRDIQAKAKRRAHPGITATVTRAIGPALEWLADAHGLDWQILDGFLYPGHTVHRMHAVPEKTGAGLMQRMLAAADHAGLPVATGAHVTALCVDQGTVSGIQVARPGGETETIRAGAVILACNGYGGNRELVARHIPEIADAPYFGHRGNTGDAVLWGQALGAETRDLSAYQGHGSLAHPHGILISWALMMEGGIQVNTAGARFSNEHEGYSEQAVKVLAQPGGIAWAVYDARVHTVGLGFPDYRAAVEAGAVQSGNTGEIAAKAGLPGDALARTLDQVRRYCTGETDPLGRDFTGTPAPGDELFAIRVTGALFHTQGGLVVDDHARVLRPGGAPIPGLYAAGGAACGVSGPDVDGYLSGNGLLTAIGLGYVAGAAAAEAAASARAEG